jgi:lipoprotein-anchoring transpeptidase ErfK/SrfK
MKTSVLRLILSLAVASSFMAGCVTPPKPPPPPPAKKPAPKESYWHDIEESGSPSIVINLSEQRAYFYKGKSIVGESTISTGRKGFDTPPGKYRVIQKDPDHVSNLYGDYVDENGDVVKKNVDVTKDKKPSGTEFRGAKMPFFMRLTQGYGMHAGYVPSYRASHGCIRLPRTMAEHFYESALEGTPVMITE